MRVFVTGATGWVGAAVVKELIDAGHQVLGLARSEDSARMLVEAGARVHEGALDDLHSLRAGASECDGVIHTAFKSDFSQFQKNADLDRRVIEAIGDVLAGSNRPFVTTSGTLMIAMATPGRLGTEQDTPDASIPRVPSELATLSLASRGVRASVMRLPPSVHGDGDRGFVPRLIDIARQTGVSGFIGDGSNRWPAVHRADAARAFRLALENGQAGARYHAVDDDGIPVRELAEIIGRRLGVPAASIDPDKIQAHFGFLAMFIGLDAPVSSMQTREQLGWTPVERGLLADLAQGRYFDGTKSKFTSG
ncbi:SDR family oxidoreductase [Salinisphaera hydrothermalis]|uniref:Putative epimerase/dehydratase n=1 Tax=Salinisphaera hydrothermalis (strain C41B8) TaxID=1304275 RepID=A0A084IJ78_SALHC|nr:SDR family oxidoreductase [Salinisphaera hydrothermalis]KEZ76762.1 putative epimerase/dehydratase [Salinisphaera hydrothermalis C41B8]